MKNVKCFLVTGWILLLFTNTVKSQNSDTIRLEGSTNITVNDLLSPSNPAFILLNTSPTAIEKPDEPIDFAVYINSLTSGFSELPDNFGISFTPSLLIDGKNLTYEKWSEDGFKPWQTLEISAASTSFLDEDLGVNRKQFSVGGKISLVRGKLSSEYQASIEKLSEQNQIILLDIADQIAREEAENAGIKKINATLNDIREQLNTMAPDDTQRIVLIETAEALLEARQAIIKKINEKYSGELNSNTINTERGREAFQKQKDIIQSLQATRVGWNVDFSRECKRNCVRWLFSVNGLVPSQKKVKPSHAA